MYGCNMKYMAAILYIWLQYYTYMAAIWLQCNIYGCNALYMAAMLYIWMQCYICGYIHGCNIIHVPEIL